MYFREMFAYGIFDARDAHWKSMRSMLTPAFSTGKLKPVSTEYKQTLYFVVIDITVTLLLLSIIPFLPLLFFMAHHHGYGHLTVACQNNWRICSTCHSLSRHITTTYWDLYRWQNNSITVISCLTSLTFWSLFHFISISFSPKTHLSPKYLKE